MNKYQITTHVRLEALYEIEAISREEAITRISIDKPFQVDFLEEKVNETKQIYRLEDN
jgi:hypothetical protein